MTQRTDHKGAPSGSGTRAIAFFVGSRDHYQLPVALAERDYLEAFITELYWPFEHVRLGKLAHRALPEPYRSLRHHPDLPSTRVKVDWRVLAAVALRHAHPQWSMFRFTDRTLGKRARKLAAVTGAAIFSYSYYVHAAFEDRTPDRPRHRFMFQLHPHPLSVRRILTEEMERYPWAAASLKREEELQPNTKRFEELCEEAGLANGWVAASSFTAQTLAENGVPRQAVHVVPYGVDPTHFPARERPSSLDAPLEVLFVGSMIQRKGLCDLLEAMRLLRTKRVRLTLAGRGFIDRDLLNHYSDVDFEVRESLDRGSLVQLMHRCDVFAFPSLVEGFGHVIAEAMCTGLPILATSHTSAADLVQHGVNGWVVPIRSPQALAEKLTWAAEHRQEVAAMGEAAAAAARELTWARFREGVRTAYTSMLASVHS